MSWWRQRAWCRRQGIDTCGFTNLFSFSLFGYIMRVLPSGHTLSPSIHTAGSPPVLSLTLSLTHSHCAVGELPCWAAVCALYIIHFF